MEFENTIAFAKKMDDSDPLTEFRERFFIPSVNGNTSIYFTGNSLGLQPRTVKKYIQQELDDWAMLGVEGHVHGKNPWLTYHEMFSSPLATIVGAKPNEVVAMNQLTVNLHLLMVSFYQPTSQRYKIICEARSFPSDQYAFESQVKYHGFDPVQAIIEVGPREGEHHIRTDDILVAIEQHRDSLALVIFGGVNYYTGQAFDMGSITEAAHNAGAYAGFDLAHAAGNIELHLDKWKVDFACWCSYKYLNSGPGGVAGVFINEKFHQAHMQKFAGWWGYDKKTRFEMEPGFKPIPTAESWQLSNAPILSMAAHKASLDIFMEATLERLHAKRKLLSAYLHFILQSILKKQTRQIFSVITPADENERGCQLSLLMHQKGKEVFDALTKKNVIADWREPGVIRVAPVPLYNTFEEAWQFGHIIETLLQA